MSTWSPPNELPDLRRVGTIALDTETHDEGLRADRGSGWPWKAGYVCGISVAWREGGDIRANYIPIRHPDTQNFDREQVFQWLRDLIASDVRTITQNGLYDWGWLRAEADIRMPPSDRMEEVGALASAIDENRFKYGLDALCEWRGLPGKDTSLLVTAVKALGERLTKDNPAAAHLWRVPAELVGPYAEADAVVTLALFENLNPILDREGTRNAYRLDVDLLPMVHEMRRRGIRIDQGAAEQARKHCLDKRDAALSELSEKLGTPTGMAEIAKPTWKAKTFDAHGINYPRTDKGNPSFKAGKTGWMALSEHWLPQLIATANKYDAAGSKFIEGHILNHIVGGRIYSEINPHRSDRGGGTKSSRFSYDHPPLQQMPQRDEELGPLIRRVFLPEEGEVWATVDCSQQEFRFIAHHAGIRNLAGAKEAIERYRNDPDTDFHEMVAEITGIPRKTAKHSNFAKAYGAGPGKFGEMIGKPLREAQQIYAQYDLRLPFVSLLSAACQREANRLGYTLLYDGARRHWDRWAPPDYTKGAGPCSYEEARKRINDPGHPWFGKYLRRVGIHTALNALIQGSAARHTKLWMRSCWREGVVPLLQMHDGLELSVTSPEQGEMVARLACEAVSLTVPMRAVQKYGRNWGDATRDWAQLHGDVAPIIPTGPIAPPDESSSAPPPEDDGLVGEDRVNAPFIPFMITRDMKARLHAGGFSDEQISGMTPRQAHDHLGAAQMMAQSRQEAAGAGTAAPAVETIDAPQAPHPNGCGRTFEQIFGMTVAQLNDRLESAGSGTGQKSTNGSGNGRYPHGEDNLNQKVGEFVYRDLKGAPYLKIVKHKTTSGKKAFPQYRWENGGWKIGKPEGPAIPYRLPELLAAPAGSKVWIGEGEKDADTLAALGLIATTNPGGAGKWQPELAKWFTGYTTAYVCEDNDDPGRKHVATVAGALSAVVPDVRIVKFHDLAEHGDVTDWMATPHTLEELWARAEQAPKFAVLESSRAADEEIEAIEWVWPGRYALGKIGLMVGLPDQGKGLFLSHAMACITRGLPWPCDEGHAPVGNVILLTAEDDTRDTIVPRLMAAGADLARVHIIKMMHDAGNPRMFSLVTDLGPLRQKILEVGDVKMVIIDPISAYLGVGKVDSFRATDVRAILGPLKELAEELRLCVLGVLHFNKKTDVTSVVLRISDSLAYGAAARHVYAIVSDDDNSRKLLIKGKNNLAPRDQQTLAFIVDDKEVGNDPKTGAPIRAPFLIWQAEPVDITAVEAMQAVAASKSPSARNNATQFLEAMLGSGPVESTEVLEAGKENGYSRNMLRDVLKKLGGDIKHDGELVNGSRKWRWHLPPMRED